MLAVDEDQWFDRKSTKIAPKDLGPPLVALANAEGGVLVIGASKGRVDGIRDYSDRLNDFRQVPMDFTNPPVRARFEQVRCINDKGETDTVLVIRVDPSERVHETQNGECYLRVGDESRKLTFAQRQELQFDKGQSQYDGFAIPDVGIEDLDQTLVENYRDKTGAKLSAAKLFAARSLLTMKGELTNAGYLLFAEHPQMLFPQAYIRVLRFLTPERGTGARLGLEEGEDHRIEGAIPWAIQEARRLIETLVPRRRSLTEHGTFEGRPIVPKDAGLRVWSMRSSIAPTALPATTSGSRSIQIESRSRAPGAFPDLRTLTDRSRSVDLLATQELRGYAPTFASGRSSARASSESLTRCVL